jgi:hypothetical protein
LVLWGDEWTNGRPVNGRLDGNGVEAALLAEHGLRLDGHRIVEAPPTFPALERMPES